MSNESKKKELKEDSTSLLEVRKLDLKAQPVSCQPEIEEGAEPQPSHEIQATKVYVFINSLGHELGGMVICPVHVQPIPVNVTHRVC